MDKDPSLLADLDRLVDPVTRGDPESLYAGRARACAAWRRNSDRKAMRSVIRRWLNCCMHSTTAYKPTKRRWKGASMRIETRNLNTSIAKLNAI